MCGITLIDEDYVKAQCQRLKGILEGRISQQECLGIVFDLDRNYRFAGEKTARLKRLFAQKRINDLSQWHCDVYSNIQAIVRLASIQNQVARQRIEELKRFRVEVRPAYDWDRSPITFHASLYVNERYHGAVTCVVTDDELNRLPIATRSLSERETRRRRIRDYYRSFEIGFPTFIERCWENGIDLTEKRRITWTEVSAD